MWAHLLGKRLSCHAEAGRVLPAGLRVPVPCFGSIWERAELLLGVFFGMYVKTDVRSGLKCWLWGAGTAPGEGVELLQCALSSSCLFLPHFLLRTRFL